MSRWARRALRAIQGVLPPRRRGVRILAYHLVEGGTSSVVDLPRVTFQRQMEELAKIGEAASMESALAALEDGSAANRPLVVLTFDDAFENFHSVVWPVLRDLDLPATLFVPVGFVEGTDLSPLAGAELLPCSWDQLASMAWEGLAVGSHSWSHPDLRTVPLERLDRELAGSRRRLEERLGTPVDTFCYPRGLWDRACEAAVAHSYRAACIGGGGRALPGDYHPLRLQRVSVRRDGPASLAPVLAAGTWLEERWADRLRRRRRRRL